MTNILLVNDNIKDYNIIVKACNENSYAITYNQNTDTYDSILKKYELLLQEESDKISSINHLALVTHGVLDNYFTFLEKENKLLLDKNYKNIINDNKEILYYNNLETWNDFIKFIEKFNIKKSLDFLGCALLKYDYTNWKYIFLELEKILNLNVRASDDNTGNLKSGGDWILESDNVNIKELYFNKETIEYWNYTLNNITPTLGRISDAPMYKIVKGYTNNRLYTDPSYNEVGNLFYNVEENNLQVVSIDASNNVNWTNFIINNKERIDISGNISLIGDIKIPNDKDIMINDISLTLNSSDDRIKSYEEPLNNSLDIIEQINGVIYEKHPDLIVEADKEDNDLTDVKHWTESGVIAQNIQSISGLEHITSVYDKTNQLLSVNYNGLIPYIIEGIKEMKNNFDASLNELQTSLNNIQTTLSHEEFRILTLENS